MDHSRTPVAVRLSTIAVAAAIVLSGCSAAGEIVQDQARAAGCAIASSVIDRVAEDLGTAIADVPVDPAAALPLLRTARTVLAGLEDAATEGVVGTDVKAVLAMLDELIPLVEAAGEGAGDPARMQQLTDRLADEVTALSSIC